MSWITCPGCGLKHSPRPDGLCPKCRTRTADAAAQPPLPPNPAFARPAFDRPPSPAAPLPTSAWGGPPVMETTPVAATGASATLTVGSLLSRTFSTWWANVGRFAGSLLLAYLPIAGAGFVAAIVIPNTIKANPGRTTQEAMLGLLPLFVLAGLAAIVLILAQFGGVTFASLQHLAGRRVGFGAMLRAGLRRAWPLLVVGLAAGLSIWAGMLLLVVPGVILALGLTVVIPVVVAEDVGVSAAFRRSFALTKGSRGTIFGALFLVGLAMWGASLVGNLAAALNSAAGVVGLLLSVVAQIAMTPLTTVLCAVAYHDLRVAKEGVDTSELAKVFE